MARRDCQKPGSEPTTRAPQAGAPSGAAAGARGDAVPARPGTPGLAGPALGRNVRIALALILLGALVIRAALVATAQPILVSDARDYHVLARNLAEGRGYIQVYHGETQAFEGFTFRAFRPPGYPALLAAVHGVLGWNVKVALGLNVIADLATQVFLFLIARRLFGVRAALFAALLFGVHVLWTINPMSESVFTALFTGLALLLVRGTPRRSTYGALAFGLLAAAGVFIRPITLCFFPVIFGRELRERSLRGLALAGLTLAPTLAGLAAWGWRNYRLFGVPVLLSTNFGHHNAADYALPADYQFGQLRKRGLNEAEINASLVRMEAQRIREFPGPWAWTMVQRGAQLFSLAPPYELERVLWLRFWGEPPVPSAARAVYRASYKQYLLTYALATAGAVLVVKHRRSLGGLGWLAGAYVVLHAFISRGDIRLVAPLYPVMCLAAGYLVVAFASKRQ